jgi:hypothetical protein
MRAIKRLIELDKPGCHAQLGFDNGSLWVVNKTKTGYSARNMGKVTNADRRQIADELWAAFKHWESERKYALRVIVKHLKGEQDAVDTPTDPDERRGS